MNDLELADEIVARGVGRKYRDDTGVEHNFYILDDESFTASGRHPKDFVRDWRVVGALLELCVGKPDWMVVVFDQKCSSEGIYRCWVERTHSGIETETYHARAESSPRAIIEACVKALKP